MPLIILFAAYRFNMFRTLLCPSSGVREYNVDYHIGRFVLGLLYVGVRWGYAGVMLKPIRSTIK
jgi:hypothetical protein